MACMHVIFPFLKYFYLGIIDFELLVLLIMACMHLIFPFLKYFYLGIIDFQLLVLSTFKHDVNIMLIVSYSEKKFYTVVKYILNL